MRPEQRPVFPTCSLSHLLTCPTGFRSPIPPGSFLRQNPAGHGQPDRFRFPGQYFDNETGLHYNLSRYYDPELGRYLETDPIGQAGGLNLYAYAGADPVNALDPFGLVSVNDKRHNVGIIDYDYQLGKWVTSDWLGTGRTTVEDFHASVDVATGSCFTTFGRRLCCKCPKYYLCTNHGENNHCKAERPDRFVAGAGGEAGRNWNGEPVESLYKSAVGISGKWSQGYASNFSAGFGDTISFGLTDWIRDQMGTNSVVDKQSSTYTAGKISGYALEAAAGGVVAKSLSRYGARLAVHGPHHTFGRLGRLPHVQLNIWKKGVKGSGKAFRLPFLRR